jgi:hypothetical protein
VTAAKLDVLNRTPFSLAKLLLEVAPKRTPAVSLYSPKYTTERNHTNNPRIPYYPRSLTSPS